MPENKNGEIAQSALIVIDSKTGDILGSAGSVGEKKGNRLQNFATQTQMIHLQKNGVQKRSAHRIFYSRKNLMIILLLSSSLT